MIACLILDSRQNKENSDPAKSNDSPSMLVCHSLMPASQNEL